MKIFSAAQIQKWDIVTIAQKPVASVELMEKAATACYKWIMRQRFANQQFCIFCGKGNNGGDGLALARLLIQADCPVKVYIAESGKKGTPDFQINLERLHRHTTGIHFIQSEDFFPQLDENDLVIDSLFGTGLNKPLACMNAALADHINRSATRIISIDIPSGLFADHGSKGNIVIHAAHTLSFQSFKLAFLLAENESYCGDVHILNIGLDKNFEIEEKTVFELTDEQMIKAIYRPRKKFAHKGTFGHAALIAGCYGMMGAAVLAAKSCLRSGVGKLTSFIPKPGIDILQVSVPEAMCKPAGDEYISYVPDMDIFDAVGIGPGLGICESHIDLLKEVFKSAGNPLLADADALNIVAAQKELLALIPANSVLTPHPKEFERLFGEAQNDFDRLDLALQKSKEHQLYIVLKGHYTFITTPYGKGYFNSTGNAGMATPGSGDVLAGIITSFLAQGYPSLEACILGVYLHGLAGDIAAQKFSQEAMVAGDIVECLGDAFKKLKDNASGFS